MQLTLGPNLVTLLCEFGGLGLIHVAGDAREVGGDRIQLLGRRRADHFFVTLKPRVE